MAKVECIAVKIKYTYKSIVQVVLVKLGVIADHKNT